MKKLLWLLPILLVISGIMVYPHRNTSSHPVETQSNFSAPKPLSPNVIISLVNDERVKAGVAPLQVSSGLMASSSAKCQDEAQNNYYAHVSPSGKTPWDFIEVYYPSGNLGENLAEDSYTDESQPVQAWMASPEHKANILNPAFKYTGVAVCDTGNLFYQNYVVQHFAS